MIEVVVDFETRSRIALSETNIYKYARHPSTEVLCCSFTWPDGSQLLWEPSSRGWTVDDAIIDTWLHHDSWRKFQFAACNAEFELAIWNEICAPRYGWPILPPEQLHCIAARAAYAGLPRRLEQIGNTLGLGAMGKDGAGHDNMQILCAPRTGRGKAKLDGCEYVGGQFDETPEKHAQNERYCLQDGRAELAVSQLVMSLPETERRLWLAHQEINARGVPVDLALCRNATQLAYWERDKLGVELRTLTTSTEFPEGEAQTPDCVQAIKTWIARQEFKLLDLREETLDWALEGNNGSIPPNVKRVLDIRKLCRNKAVTKYQTMLNHAEADGRCRGAHMYYKAGTGRFASPGVNFNNLFRLNEDDVDRNLALAEEVSTATPELLLDTYERLSAQSPGVIPALGGIVRLAVCGGPGKKIDVSDYSSIENRVPHWLAGDGDTLNSIRAYDAGKGEELYKIAAGKMYTKAPGEVTKSERQRGKVMILGAGYLSGGAKFQGFCAQYGIDMTLEEATGIIQFYRRTFPLVVRFWYAVAKAVCHTVKTRKPTQVGIIQFYMLGDTLNIRLPSERELKYRDARLIKGTYGDELEAIDQRSGARRTVGLPVLIENIDQAVSRDLLADALLKCQAEHLPVVLHVYDEIVLETDENDEASVRALQDIMCDTPSWARGLPVEAKCGSHKRYVK